jgi:hypothetical protein
VTFVAFLLNLPWTIGALFAALLSVPQKASIHRHPFALVFEVKSFWWLTWLKGYRNARAITQGSVVILGPKLLPNDIEHELIHIEQLKRAPFIQPFLYGIESLKHGHSPKNKYENEAYSKSNSTYLGKKITEL